MHNQTYTKHSGQEALRQEILTLTRRYFQLQEEGKTDFKPGMRVAYAGRVYDDSEMSNLMDSSLEFFLTAGRWAQAFEQKLSDFLDVKHCLAVNSGSSANLIALMTLTSPLLGDRRLQRGDEVITVAAGFPTTVSPIVQFGAVPVFIDVSMPQYNVDVSLLEQALSPRTKAVMLAHTLGNPFDLVAVASFCHNHGLWLIEDNCDALGSQITWEGKPRYTGTIGDIGTSSFYPPHQITMGEGGAVYTNDPLLYKIALSLRDWGRDCQCPPGVDNMCGRRYEQQFGQLPLGYDHKFVYSHFGYNLKVTDMQAAVGCAQLDKLPYFVEKRHENWDFLRKELDSLSEEIILPEPLPGSSPCWFGFLMTLNPPFSRNGLAEHLENCNIQTRNLFAGNLIRHPAFDALRDIKDGYRVVGGLERTDRIMRDSVWVGVYPGISRDMAEYMVQQIKSYFKKD